MGLNSVKRFAAQVFDLCGLNSAGHFVQRLALSPFIRVINYHDIPAHLSENFSAQLRFYATRFVNVGYQDLVDFLQGGKWRHDRPGLIISFDDGLRSHYEVAAPLLEKHGFTGWFFVPAGLIEGIGGRSAADAAASSPLSADENLTLEQLRYLDSHHVVGCHTETHCRLSKDVPTEKLQTEILEAKRMLERALGHSMKIFCWVGGEEYTYSREAAQFIKQGYELSFMTNNAVVRHKTNPLQLQRTNIEAENPLWLVRFQTSGLMDIAYYPKRKRVNRLTE
jgi:peptidoglycan/xylan/chitin deacetylase (PgdA/CDA1 family)